MSRALGRPPDKCLARSMFGGNCSSPVNSRPDLSKIPDGNGNTLERGNPMETFNLTINMEDPIFEGKPMTVLAGLIREIADELEDGDYFTAGEDGIRAIYRAGRRMGTARFERG
jgi:hypothetical protein